MPRKVKKVTEKELHAQAPWNGYVNITLNKQDKDRLVEMCNTLEVESCLDEMVSQYYKISVSYDSKRGFRVTALGCMGSKNPGKCFSGYSGSSVANAVYALYYRVALMLEYDEYKEIQLSMDFS